jgi:hypothetical protein
MSDPLLPNSNTQATQLWLPLLAAQFFAPCSSSSRTSAPASASTATEMEVSQECVFLFVFFSCFFFSADEY